MSLNLLNDLIEQAKLEFMQSNTIHDLELARAKFLGKSGYLNQKLKSLKNNKSDIRIKLGTEINKAKKDIYKVFISQKNILKLNIINKSLYTEELDITLPGRSSKVGSLHPISNIIQYIKNYFYHLGFNEIHGPEIENSYFNFDALNIPDHHPARNQHDTFWIDAQRLLRTHTSGIQIRSTINKITFPIQIISIGKVYRKDYDNNHTPMFHQVEGLIVGANINFTNLKKILYDFLYDFFGKNITLRFKPSYFPFTEPSGEIDIMNILKNQYNNEQWIELLGCGMIHPKVLRNMGVDSKKNSGFAFGIGIERLTMLKYNLTDIRIFFENDLQFLNQF